DPRFRTGATRFRTARSAFHLRRPEVISGTSGDVWGAAGPNCNLGRARIPVWQDRRVDADEVRFNDYDNLAEAYAAENETSLTNAYHERPATPCARRSCGRQTDPRRRLWFRAPRRSSPRPRRDRDRHRLERRDAGSGPATAGRRR